MPLNKKLIDDLKQTHVTKKIAFIHKNADNLISLNIFDECVKQLELSGKDLLLKKNGEAKYKQFEIERKKLMNLPQEIEKRKKAEQARREEIRNEHEQLRAIKKTEEDWLERYSVFTSGLTERLVSGLKITHLNHWAEFGELKESKPEGLTEFKLDTYPKFLRQFAPYVDFKNKKLNTKKSELDQKKSNIKIAKWISGLVAGIAVISLGIYGYLKKSNENQTKADRETRFIYDQNDKLIGVEEKGNSLNNLRSSSDTLYGTLKLKIIKPDPKIVDRYLEALDQYIKDYDYQDMTASQIQLDEMKKLNKTEKNLLIYGIETGTVQFRSTDEANQYFKEAPLRADLKKKREIKILSVTAEAYFKLYYVFEYKKDFSRSLYSLNEAKKLYREVLKINPTLSTAQARLAKIEEIIRP